MKKLQVRARLDSTYAKETSSYTIISDKINCNLDGSIFISSLSDSFLFEEKDRFKNAAYVSLKEMSN